MSIRRRGNYHLVGCDYCGHEERFECDNDWSELMSMMSDGGWWKLKDKDTGQWSHKCPECVEKGRRPAAMEPAPEADDDTKWNDAPEKCFKTGEPTTIEDCEKCGYHNPGHGCTFDEDDPF